MPAAALRRAAELDEGVGRRVAFAADGSTWAAASRHALHVWRDAGLETTAYAPPGPLDAVRFARDGSAVLAAPFAFDLARRDWAPLPPLGAALVAGLEGVEREGFAPYASAWAPDGRHLVVYAEYRPPRGVGARSSYKGATKRLLLMDGRLREVLGILWEGSGWEGYGALATDERSVAAAGMRVSVWRLAGQERVADLEGHAATVRALAFAPGGDALASVAADGRASVWDVGRGEQLASWTAHDGDASAVAFRPDGRGLATGGWDGRVRLWSAGGDLEAEDEPGGHVEDVAFAPSGDRLVAACSGPEERLVMYTLSG